MRDMEQTGKVISISGNIAVVEVVRNSACSSCHSKDSCGASVIAGCGKSKKSTLCANNLSGACVGDVVRLTTSSSLSLGVAFCVFILPIVIGFMSYYITTLLTDGNTLPYIVSVCLFVASFFGMFFGFDKFLSKRINVNISEILKSYGDNTLEK